ncbi:MAG: hypothetical protein JNK64_42200 [Myxococcales bacterium]|nr:hypothetical protein [Myxococcales bacterium]
MRRAVALAAVVAIGAGCRPAASPPPAHAEARTTSLTEDADLDEAAAAEAEAEEERAAAERQLEEGRMGSQRERARPAPPILIAHNRVRAEHCAEPLAWSDELAAEAAAWANQLTANGCAFEHSRSDHGENLAAGTSGALDADAVVAMWAREEEKYDFRRPAFSMKTGHFTQVVWKDTLAVGCGVATCAGRDTWVCNYDPPGNVEGDYALNVAPRGCR